MTSVRLRNPDSDANKYSRGKLTLVAGSRSYPGAAALAGAAGYAALRCGAGYAQVICAPQAVGAVQAFRPSLVVSPWGEGSVLPGALGVDRAGKPCACVVGPGFDAADAECMGLVGLVLAAQAPVVVDGGGLGALAAPAQRERLARRFAEGLPTVITPHMGEAARLAAPAGISVSDPALLSRSLAREYQVIAVVKGPVTYISDGMRVQEMAEGTPALAKAGTGDVLAGILGGILAQGASAISIEGAICQPKAAERGEMAYHAAVLACRIHALAAKIAESEKTRIACTAEDVVEAIPRALREFEGI